MKKVLATCFGILFVVSTVAAEPILTEEAKCLEKGNLEIGLTASYGVDSWKWADNTAGDSIVSLTVIQMPVKYGVSDKLQLGINIPYRSWKSELEMGTTPIDTDEAGIGQVCVGGKLGLSENIAIGLDIQSPTGDVDKSLGEGTNIGLNLIASGNLDPLKISGNVGYLLKTKYEDEDDVEYDPGDPIIVKAALEYPMNEISLIGEAQGQLFGKTKVNDVKDDDSDGSTIDLLTGIQYLKDAMKLKLGVEFAIGDEDFRAGLNHFYDSWDYKVILSGSYKFEI
ncbi:MAG: transporter [Elusimicrobia bacterium]|nr:transporter [Elusimicrobiota bacterium]